jgi:DNA-binding MarR family transcriptional regulator
MLIDNNVCVSSEVVLLHRNGKGKNLISFNEKGEIEEMEEVSVLVRTELRHFKKGAFYMTSFDFDTLILENDYGRLELRLLSVLKRRLDFNNRIKTFKQVDLAKEIGSDRSNISRALKRFIEDGIIRTDGLDYYFSDKYIKGAGDTKHRKKAEAAQDGQA